MIMINVSVNMDICIRIELNVQLNGHGNSYKADDYNVYMFNLNMA